MSDCPRFCWTFHIPRKVSYLEKRGQHDRPQTRTPSHHRHPRYGKDFLRDKFACEFGFVHCNVEDSATAQHLSSDPEALFEELTRLHRNVVVTWGFHPEDSVSLEIVRRLRNAGFRLIWFDGNRPAALRAFRKRGTVSEEAFVAQMQRIERTKIVERLKPTIINPFDENSQFKSAEQILEEIRKFP